MRAAEHRSSKTAEQRLVQRLRARVAGLKRASANLSCALIVAELVESVVEHVPVVPRLVLMVPRPSVPAHKLSSVITQAEAGAIVVLEEINVASALVQHVRVLRQHENGNCGYHALKNVKLAVQACFAASGEEARARLALIESRPFFWHHFHSHQKLLKKQAEVKQVDWWPWDAASLASGEMERTYLNHILEADSELAALSTGADVSGFFGDGFEPVDCAGRFYQFHFGYSRILNSDYQYDHKSGSISILQGAIDRFCQAENDCLGIVCGLTNHWTCVVATKTAGVLEVQYFDSMNVLTLTSSESELQQYIDGKSRERVAKGKRAYTRDESGTYLQSFQDQRAAVLLLTRCLNGDCNLFVESTHLLSEWVLATFRDIVPPMLAVLPSANMPAARCCQVLQQHFGAEATAEATVATPRGSHQRFVRSVAEAVDKLDKLDKVKPGADGTAAVDCNCFRLLVNVWLECQLRPSHVRDCTIKRIVGVGVSKIRTGLRAQLVAWAYEVQYGCGAQISKDGGRRRGVMEGEEKGREGGAEEGVAAEEEEEEEDLASQLLTVLGELTELLSGAAAT
jgi:hypothetical protein